VLDAGGKPPRDEYRGCTIEEGLERRVHNLHRKRVRRMQRSAIASSVVPQELGEGDRQHRIALCRNRAAGLCGDVVPKERT